MTNYLNDADHEARIGVSDTPSDLAIRQNPKDAVKATDLVKSFLKNTASTALIELCRDEEALSMSLDEYAMNLVVHSVAKSVRIDSEECDELMKHDTLLLRYQDAELNTALHYLAYRGMNLFGRVPLRWLLTRNRKGATVLHFMAKNPVLKEKVLALPQDILVMKTKRGISIQDTVVAVPKETDVLKKLATDVVETTARAPATEVQPFKIASTKLYEAFVAMHNTIKSGHESATAIDKIGHHSFVEPTFVYRSFDKVDNTDEWRSFTKDNKRDLDILAKKMGAYEFSDFFGGSPLFFLLPQMCPGIYFHKHDDSCCIVKKPVLGNHVSTQHTGSVASDRFNLAFMEAGLSSRVYMMQTELRYFDDVSYVNEDMDWGFVACPKNVLGPALKAFAEALDEFFIDCLA